MIFFKIKIFALLILTFYVLSAPAFAADGMKPFITIKKPPSFGLPIDCEIGAECWVMNYMDYGANDQKNTDMACLNRTYDGHKGTDFALRDGAAMTQGVNVLAAKDGTIKRIRDGEADGWWDEAALQKIKDARKECGNAIMIEHENNIQTIYCHLKQNSIRVKPEKSVKKGDAIAQVGQSGMSEFPHLHFGIIKDNKIIDPFTGLDNTQECGDSRYTLWDKDIDVKYQPFLIQDIGFSTTLPELEKLEREIPALKEIENTSDVLVFWGIIWGAREGDKITLEIRDPNNKPFAARDITQDKNRARQFYFTGKKITTPPLMAGVYTATLTLSRPQENAEDLKQTKTNMILVKP